MHCWGSARCSGPRRQAAGSPRQPAPREAGSSKWGYWRLWNLALEGITGFTTLPLRVATYLGLLVAVLAVLYAAYIAIRTLLFGNPVPGYSSLMVSVLFLGGTQLIGIGIMGEYIGRIYMEGKHRPRYVVKEILRGGEQDE